MLSGDSNCNTCTATSIVLCSPPAVLLLLQLGVMLLWLLLLLAGGMCVVTDTGDPCKHTAPGKSGVM